MRGFDEEQTGEEIWWNDWYEEEAQVCEACEGQRLNSIALNVRFRDQSIAQWTAQSVAQARSMFGSLKLRGRELEIARDVLAEISSRLGFFGRCGSWVSCVGSIGADAIGRRSPAHSLGGSARLESAGRVLHPG